jgi:hypothetical protein
VWKFPRQYGVGASPVIATAVPPLQTGIGFTDSKQVV